MSQSVINKMEKIKLEHSQVKLVFDVTADEFEKALDAAFEVKNATVTIKGFRKGKAPRSAFEKNYGVEALYDEALNVILNDKVAEAVKDEELTKQMIGKFNPLLEEEIKRGETFKIALLADVMPEIVLPEYKGIEVAKKVLTASDEEVANAIKAVISKDVTKVAKDGAIEKGDYAVFDFVGSVDGVEFEGGKAENYELQIGSGQFIPGFEDQMLGMKVNEEKDLNVKFPEQYQAADLAGKDAVFHVTVHEIKAEQLPELTEDYIKGLNIEGVTTEAELKANKKAELEANKAVSEKDRQFDEIVNKILDAAKIDMPATLINERVDAIRGQYINQAKMYNIPFETFLGLMNITKEAFDTETYKQGSRQALFSVIAGEIISVEKLAPTEEAINAKAEEIAKASGKTVEDVKKTEIMTIFNELSYNALSDFLLSNAKEI